MSVRILEGDCRAQLASLPDRSVQCCVTSPPYFGLRDYGHAGQIGLEPTPEAYVAELVAVFREVRRVLRDDGTLWLNLGDSYAGSGRGGNPAEASSTLQGGQESQTASMVKRSRNVVGPAQRIQCPAVSGTRLPAAGRLKEKDLIGIPWLVAFALRNDGAASPAHMRDIERMIEAVAASYDSRAQWPDRIAAEVERLQREHTDANRGGWYLRQDLIWFKRNPMPESIRDRCTKAHEYLFLLSKSARYHYDADAIAEPVAPASIARMSQPNLAQQAGSDRVPGKTNGPMRAVLKSSGNLARKPAGARDCPEGSGSNVAGSVPWEGTHRNKRSVWDVPTQPFSGAHFATFPPDLVEPCILAGCPAGGTVLDPFGGAGTSGLVADRLGRNAVLIELNPDYAQLARARIAGDSPLFSEVA